jgi:hypothetical protein
MIVALIEFLTAVWLSLYMGWAVHSLRLIPRFTNTLLACCGKRYQDVYYEDDNEDDHAAKGVDEQGGKVRANDTLLLMCCLLVLWPYVWRIAAVTSNSILQLSTADVFCSALPASVCGCLLTCTCSAAQVICAACICQVTGAAVLLHDTGMSGAATASSPVQQPLVTIL